METRSQQPQQYPNTTSDGRDTGTSQPHPSKVIVSGFPGGLPARQLEELFPGSRVETLGWRRATLSFPSGAEAEAALRARVCVDGAPLTVTIKHDRAPRNAPLKAPPEKKNNKKRPRPPEKELEPSLDPHKIDFSGDFHQQLDAVLAHVRLSQEEVARISQLFEDVECVLQEYWPGCTAHPFGSITSGLGVKGSDADCLVLTPQPDQHAVTRARRLLRRYPDTFRQVLAIPAANTPIVKFLHAPTNTSADVSFKTTLGVRNSRLLAFLLHADSRALPAAVCVKYWGRVGGFTGSGKLTNYALTLMMVFYLQSRVLPAVCWLQSEATAHIVDGWDTGFDTRYEALPPTNCDASIADLIGGFFEFYSMFNFKEYVISPFLGQAIKKSLFDNPHLLPPEYELYKQNILEGRSNPLRAGTPMCVQDPFEHSHNVASMVNEARANEIKAYIAFAAAAYKKEKERNCVGFLKQILLEKPVIQVKKKLPEYRMVLKDSYLCLVRGDWQDIVRDATLQVFEKILKFTLTRVEEKENTNGKETTVKKERYLAVLTKPIWRRKQVSKDIHVVKCSFLERQGLITQEILTNNPSVFNVPFKLEIQLSNNKNRRAVVSIGAASEVSLDSGKVQKFRDFGNFFLGVIQGWIYQLLEHHLLPLRERYTPKQRKDKRQDTPLDNGAHSSDEEYVFSGPIVIHNSAQTKESDRIETTVADITESVKKSLGLADEFKFNFRLDKSIEVDNKEVKPGESSITQPVDIENSSPVDKST